MSRSDLFLPIDPFDSGRLQVDDMHNLYFEQSGNRSGTPVLFLHGGPGAGASPTHRRFFDPQKWRIVIFDQRGCGRSTPNAEIRQNTPDLLVQDIETLRQHLGIEKWHVFGGSWGSTLSLLYAQSHPDRVLGLILRGLFMMTPREIGWFLYHMRMFYPEAWRDFASHIPEEERDDLLEAYWRRLTDEDPAIQLSAAKHWSRYEASCACVEPNRKLIDESQDPDYALAIARLEAHYFRNNRFEPEDRLFRDIDIIRHIPTAIIQGRLDTICPIFTADMLHHLWPEADYLPIANAGHYALEPPIRNALLQTVERFSHIR